MEVSTVSQVTLGGKCGLIILFSLLCAPEFSIS